MRYTLIQYGLTPTNPTRPELDGGLASTWPTLGAALAATVDAARDEGCGGLALLDETDQCVLRMTRTSAGWTRDARLPILPWTTRFRLGVRTRDERYYSIGDLTMPEVTSRMMEIANSSTDVQGFQVTDDSTGARVLTRTKQADGSWSLEIHPIETVAPNA